MEKLRIAYRKNRVMEEAAHYLKDSILESSRDLEVELLSVEAELQYSPEDPESYIKELEEALQARKADLAVHLLKEIPVSLPKKIELKSVSERITPFDAFISDDYTFLDELPEGAKLGVSHSRQSTQLGLFRSDLEFVELHGSVDSRIQQMKSRNLGGLILGAESLERLGMQESVSEMVVGNILLPSPGQGCLGILGLRRNENWNELLETVGDHTSRVETIAERAFLARMGDNPELPVAALAAMDSSELIIEGFVASSDGERSARDIVRGKPKFAEELGNKLALLLTASLGDTSSVAEES
ncbi:MAG: hydroxymethylbilane synthase [Candidatus Krumholzibacteria bacterium]|jgi:hydroxymethylbilane synthase|nr:hydroxymethylbilane synthase [Candidatus Krumholzibacteria bacterium]MDP6669733.1 hydroxymethylbilane synthase [Candidatus Krumholzibacteria bacterium]MDP6798057.1 hydroxymethylbilane synthase [Candidatus Krumholzibacteria bacterium]MDP7022491.1 hydroxymethylbilane synthase [Candidatus Krumholzibacteria bacterium]